MGHFNMLNVLFWFLSQLLFILFCFVECRDRKGWYSWFGEGSTFCFISSFYVYIKFLFCVSKTYIIIKWVTNLISPRPPAVCWRLWRVISPTWRVGSLGLGAPRPPRGVTGTETWESRRVIQFMMFYTISLFLCLFIFFFICRVNVAAAVNVLNTTSKYLDGIRPFINMN